MTNDYILTSIPAKWIDQLILYSPKFNNTKSAKLFAARALSLLISVTVLPTFLAFDLAVQSMKTLGYWTWSKFSTRSDLPPQVEKSHFIAMKCLRGMVSWPVAVLWRDVVSNHFLPEIAPDGKVHPTGGLYQSGADLKRPTSAEQVSSIVKEAIKNDQKVSIEGAGFSQGKQTLPPRETDIHIDMKQLDSITIDPTTKIATVGAGARWSAIQKVADKYQLAVQVMQASNVFSIGGSLSANCHGWDHTKGALANTVHAITIVNAQGEIQQLTPQDEMFGYVVGGYGMFGIIVEVQLQLTDNQVLYDDSVDIPIDQYVTYFQKEVQSNDNIKMHLYRLCLEPGKLLQRGWAQNYFVSKAHTESPRLEEEPERGTVADKILIQIARNSPFARKMWWQREEKNLRTIKKMTRNQIMRPPINAAFANNSSAHREWLQEYFVPGDKLSEFIRFLGKVLDENEVTLFNASVRFVTKDERIKLGYTTKGDRFAVVLFFNQSLNPDEVEKTKKWVQKVIDEVGKIDGTFYLPYMQFATREQFQKCYPHWKQVLEKKKEYDPKEVFHNGLYQDYLKQEVQ